MRTTSVTVKIDNKSLLFAGLLCIGLLSLDFFLTREDRRPEYDKMVLAAQQMSNTYQANRMLRDSLRLPVNSLTDPLLSGFIGREFTPITTTLGNLPAKQIATNPDFTALLICWFEKLALPKGGNVIIQASGSFPALAIGAIIACQEYGLEPVILSSAGASSFGANLPNCTYWDMEYHLFRTGSLKYRTAYATPGGQNDNGSSFWEGGMAFVSDAANRNSLKMITPINLRQSIKLKMDYILAKKPITLFINIGGNQSALGSGPCSYQIPSGLISEKISYAEEGIRGLIHRINDMGTPIIHLLDIQELAVLHGIPADLAPDWLPGKSSVYYRVKHNSWFAGLALFLIISTLIMAWRRTVRPRAKEASGAVKQT